MKMSNYSERMLKLAVDLAIDNCENREKTLEQEYLKFNPEDEQRRKRDTQLVLLGMMLARYAVKDEITKTIKDLAKVNSEALQ